MPHPTIAAFLPFPTLGWVEIIIFTAVAIMVFGPKPMRDLVRGIWRSIRDVRADYHDLKREILDVDGKVVSRRDKKPRRVRDGNHR